MRLAIRHHTKSRKGCITCKTRKVKCDENQPICQRCDRDGFTCDGYIVQESKKVTLSQRPHKKSRAGCFTCKARRVKCDEEKPKCGWCTKSNKECEYRSLIAGSAASQGRQLNFRRPLLPNILTLSHLSLNLIPGSEKERRTFNFYVSELAPRMPGSFDVDFWTKLLIQRACAEPTIWHSLISLSMLHQQRDVYSVNLPANEMRLTALMHYSKAMGNLTRSTTNVQQHAETLLVSCLLFVCIEVLLDDMNRAALHILNGINIINDWRSKANPVSLHHKSFVAGHLEPILVNMKDLSSLYAVYTILEDLKLKTSTLAKEFKSLVAQETETLAFEVTIAKQQDLIEQLNDWSQSFEEDLARPASHKLVDEEYDLIPFIRYQRTMLNLCLESILFTNELNYDEHLKVFEIAIDYAEDAHTSMLIRGPKFTTSSLPPSIDEISPLFTIVTKCRNPRVHRRALEFMKKTSNLSSFQSDDITTKVAERIIEIEEEGLEGLLDWSGEVVPSDWARVYEILIQPEFKSEEAKTETRSASVSFKRRSRVYANQWMWIQEKIHY